MTLPNNRKIFLPSSTPQPKRNSVFSLDRSSIFPPLILDDRIPLGEIWLAHENGRIDKLVNLNRECGQGKVGGCELGLGHPGPCLGFGPRGEYLVWEHATGRLLREI